MTRIWNPYTFTPLGNPIVGEAPPVLRVLGGMQATAQQLSYAQQRFTQFVMQARLSTVPNPTEAGRLPDGTQYRIVKVGPQTTMEIWPGGVADLDEIFHGILRENGEVEVDGKLLLHEFRGNGKPYIDTAELYGDFHGANVLNTYCWRAFNRKDLSGAAAKLAQFGRGAHVAYTQALKSRSNADKYATRHIGGGVIVGDIVEGGISKKAVYFFRYVPGTGIVTRRGEVLTEAMMKVKLPKYIKDLFGGAPLPPTEHEWQLASTALNESAILGAAAVTSGNYSSLARIMAFPAYAMTVGSNDAYFIWQEYKPHPDGAPQEHTKHSVLLMASFTFGDGYVTGAVSTASAKGIFEFSLLPVNLPEPSTHVGVIGVTHVAGALTVFRRETIFDHYDLENGAPFVKIVQQVREYWGGGSVIRNKAREWESASGSQSGTVTLSWVNVETTHYNGPADGLPEGLSAWTTVARQRVDRTGTGSRSLKEKPMTGLGQIITFGVEGVFQVSSGSRTPFDESGSANCSSWGIGPPQVVKNWISWADPPMPNVPFDASPTTTSPYTDTLAPSTGHNSFKYGGLQKWANGIGSVVLPSEALSWGGRTEKEYAFSILGFVPLTGESEDAGSTGTYTQELQKNEGVFDSETLNANGPQHSIPSMTILKKFEDDERIKEIKESGRFGFDSPLMSINTKYYPYETLGITILFNISQLGGHQCLYTIKSTATKGGVRYAERYDMGWGSLVDNPYDIHYSPISVPGQLTHFIGTTQ